jgi:PAS domain S-box-containing protein
MQEELEIAQRVSNIGHYHYNLKENIFTCSKQVENIFGIEENYEKSFESWSSIIHEDDKERIASYFNKVIELKENFDNEYRVVDLKTKEIKWIHGLGEFSYDKDGNTTTLYGTIQNITQRKNYENSLNQAIYIFENTYDSIIITDNNANIINTNSAFEKTTGYSLKDVKGLNPKVLKSGLHDEDFYKKMWFRRCDFSLFRWNHW